MLSKIFYVIWQRIYFRHLLQRDKRIICYFVLQFLATELQWVYRETWFSIECVHACVRSVAWVRCQRLCTLWSLTANRYCDIAPSVCINTYTATAERVETNCSWRSNRVNMRKKWMRKEKQKKNKPHTWTEKYIQQKSREEPLMRDPLNIW